MSSKQKLNIIIEELGALLKFEAYGVIDMMLGKSTKAISEMSEEKILAYARTTFAAKDKLPTWKKFVAAADREFKTRGLDSPSLLKGLVS
jgi:hypothetical protein